MKRKIVLFLSVILIIFTLFGIGVSASNGSCGATAVWNFDSDTGTLYISGAGAMTDFQSENDVPWNHVKNDIAYVSVAEGITHIGANAFRRLESLLSAKLPTSLVSIGDKAFAYCYVLRDVSIPSAVTTIGESAFYYCKAITEITIPSGVTAIPKDAFFGCQTLASVKMSDNVMTVADGAFYFCIKLSNLKLSAGVESIGEKAFDYCEALKTFTCTMSENEWKSVDIASGNDALLLARRYDGTALAGDLDGDTTVGANDAIYLLYNVFFGNESYPIQQDCDYNNNGARDADDAIYLLYHVFFGNDTYPI